MDKNVIVRLVEGIAAVRGVDIPANQKKKIITDYIDIALNEIVISYDWAFAIDEASTVTVADQAEYTLEGNNSDCRDIINVRYGSDLNMLSKKSAIDMDNYLHLRTHTSIDLWYPSGVKDGFPQITVVGTPTTAGKTLKYRYRRNNVTLNEFPTEFSYVLVSGVAKRLIPEFTPMFMQDLNKMIDHYSGVGGEDSPAALDPQLIRQHNIRAGLNGY